MTDSRSPIPPAGSDDPHMLLRAGQQALAERRHDDCVALAGQAQQAAAARQDAYAEADALRLAAQCHFLMGRYGQTFDPALRAASLYAKLAMPALQVMALVYAVHTLTEVGLVDDALAVGLQAAQQARDADLFEELGSALSSLAHAHARLGDFEQAEHLHLQAISRARESSDTIFRLRVYGNLLMCVVLAHDELLLRNEAEAARLSIVRALPLARQAQRFIEDAQASEGVLSVLRLNLGRVLALAGEHASGRRLLEHAQAYFEASRTQHALLSTAQALAELLRREGQALPALAAVRGLLAQDAASTNPILSLQLLATEQACLQDLGRDGEALQQRERLQQALLQRETVRRQAGQTLQATRRQLELVLRGT
jgi:tetratricopeptide (TPR) repeat protein